MIKGGTLKKMVIYTDMAAPSNSIKTKHEIRMTEVQLKGIIARKQQKLEELRAKMFICVSVCLSITAQVEIL